VCTTASKFCTMPSTEIRRTREVAAIIACQQAPFASRASGRVSQGAKWDEGRRTCCPYSPELAGRQCLIAFLEFSLSIVEEQTNRAETVSKENIEISITIDIAERNISTAFRPNLLPRADE